MLLVGNNRGFNVQEREREDIEAAIALLVRRGGETSVGGYWASFPNGQGHRV